MTETPDLADWLRLLDVPGVGPVTGRLLLSNFGLPQQVFAASRSELAAVIGDKLADTLLRHDNPDYIHYALDWQSQPGRHIITLADEAYPRALFDTTDPPLVLYAHGNLGLLNRPAIAVVGARNATPQGVDNAERFAQALSAAGLTIISGLALGIDAAAHRGGVALAGSTIAVVGTGADRIYPARNEMLARQIAEQGLVISEFPLGTGPLRENFPRRNRIISGLAKGVLVVEAADRSGSLITARQAAEQGRDVFAIPGSIHSPLSKGCHLLIKQGAKLVDDARDILVEINWQNSPAPSANDSSETQATSAVAADASDPVLAQMGFDPVTEEALIDRTGLTSAMLSAKLLELELAGHIARLPGGRLQRTLSVS